MFCLDTLYDGKYSISEVKGNKNLTLRYDIYGNITNTKLTQEDKTIAYNTLEYTPQNNLTYIRARYYDSSTGTFISKDTYLGNIYKPTTTNRYAYCSGDPVNYMDQDGHKKFAVDPAGNSRLGYEPPSKPKSSSGVKKSSNTPSSNNIVITYEDSGGHEHVYIPNPTEKYMIQEIIKKSANNDDAISQINKLLTGSSTSSIKQIILANDTSNMSVLSYATEPKISKSTQELIKNTMAERSLDPFGEIDNEKYGFYKEYIDKIVTKESSGFIGGYEQGVKLKTFYGDDTQNFSSYTRIENNHINLLSLYDKPYTTSTFGFSYKNDNFRIGVESDVSTVGISINVFDYHLSVSAGLGLGISVGTDNFDFTIKGDINKISVKTEIKDNNGNSVYKERYLNTINTALVAVPVVVYTYELIPLLPVLQEAINSLQNIFNSPQVIPVR